MRRFRVLP